MARVTCFGRTGVVVVAGRRNAGRADRRFANVAVGAGVLIIARQRVIIENTATLCIAAVVRARVAVVAHKHFAGGAGVVLAQIADRAGVAVIAGVGVWVMYATVQWIATVCCTRVIVVTRQANARGAAAICAGVADRARVVVVASGRIIDVFAPGRRVATVVAAQIAVAAGRRLARDAQAAAASVADGARAAIATRDVVVDMRAPKFSVTTICCANVIVIAVGRATGQANGVFASVADGANAAVFAGDAVGVGVAPAFRQTSVGRARVAVAANFDS